MFLDTPFIFSGRLTTFQKFLDGNFTIDEVLAKLFKMRRFQNETDWTVGHHSYLVWRLFNHVHPGLDARWCILHDAHEAPLGDVIRPLKNALGQAWESQLDELTNQFDVAISKKSGIDRLHLTEIKEMDRLAAQVELAYFFPVNFMGTSLLVDAGKNYMKSIVDNHHGSASLIALMQSVLYPPNNVVKLRRRK